MPYRLSGNNVVYADTGKVVPGGTHSNPTDARKHLAALEINVSDAKANHAEPTRPVGLREAAINSQQRCSTCTYYSLGMNGHGTCDKFGSYGVDDDDTCNMWEADGGQKGVVPNKQRILRVYANPFGGPLNGKDEHGQWFDHNTQFWEKQLPLPPSVYYHGRNPDGTPAGLPEFTGPTIARGVDSKGVWYDVALDTQHSQAAQRLASTPSDQIRASAGVVPATKRIAPNGHIDSWMNGEISIFDIDPAVGRMPVNDYAVGTHIKALYQQAGLSLPNVAGQGGSSVNIDKIIDFFTMLLGLGGGAAPMGAAAGQNAGPTAPPLMPAAGGTGGPQAVPYNQPAVAAAQGMGNSAYANSTPDAKAPALGAPLQGAAQFNGVGTSAMTTALGADAAPVGQKSNASAAVAPSAEKERGAHDHTHDHNDGTRHSHNHGHDNGLGVHDHEHAAAEPAIAPNGPDNKAPVPEKLEGKEMTNQKDDTLKAGAAPAETDEMKALVASLSRRVKTEAEAWSMGLMKSGRMVPAERPLAIQMYVQLAMDGSMKAGSDGDSPSLIQFKALFDQREPNMIAGDLDPTNLKAAGMDSAKHEGAPDQARKAALMGMSTLGRQIIKDGARQRV